MKKVAIIGGARTPFARSFSKYLGITNQELMTSALTSLVNKYNLHGKALGEVACGAVMAHSRDWNFARECSLGSGLSAQTPAYTMSQACGTSLAAAINVANKIATGQIECGIAGGVDTNSDLPVVFGSNFSQALLKLSRARSMADKVKIISSLRPTDFKPIAPAVTEPRTGLSMGQSCELMAKEWKLTQAEQDELAYQSHQNAIKAYADGFYKDLVFPVNSLDKDDNVRESTLEKMASLKPAFDRKSGNGTLTAGNSSTLTDGAACVLLASEEWAQKNNLPILAYFTYSETAAVDFVGGEGLLMAPAFAVPRMLKRANLSLQDFDLYEIHEAFAAQVLCTLRAWESESFCNEKLGLDTALGSIDQSKMNIKGGSVALGHPFAATGARIIAGLAKMLDEKGSGKGLVSICTGGGMGVTAILEK